MSISEIEIINQFFNKPLNESTRVKCGIGDDAAVIDIPEGMELVLAMDTLVVGVHFFATAKPYDIGYKSLAVNLSDMAAMGAEPHWATLSLTLPEADHEWLTKFAEGFFYLADLFSIDLIGGDVNHGPLSITVQIQGLLPAGTAIKRSGAIPEDIIYVSGFVGDAGLALKVLNNEINLAEHEFNYVSHRLYRPDPRIELGLLLRGVATSAIDISDGLIADLGHILVASQVGASLNPELLPLSDAYKSIVTEKSWDIALTAGDDYELCFTVPVNMQKTVEQWQLHNCPLTCIGNITRKQEMEWVQSDGSIYTPEGSGFQHFRP